ncbi:MAG: phage major capsid protein [Clostridia bacterium]|nr:phage major capsid protein [Clostridia bacterium]
MTFDTLKLDKGLYTSNKGFSKSLEEIDPSENYKGTELEGLDAFERQLKRFDIKVKGENSDSISKFFQTSNSAVLFPEFVRRSVAAVVETGNVVDDIVATTTVIDSTDYRSAQCPAIESKYTVDSAIEEGTFIPEIEIKLNDKLTKLYKSGRCLVASYEAIKTQRIDLFAVMLKQIGNYINACQLNQALKVLSAEGSIDITATNLNKVTFNDLLNMYTSINPYDFNTIVAETEQFKSIASIAEMRDSEAGLNIHATGKNLTPFGAKLIHCKTNVLDGAVVGFDKNYAIEKVQLGDIVTDFDKLIDRQIERATVTSTVGFNRIVDNAVIYLAKKE